MNCGFSTQSWQLEIVVATRHRLSANLSWSRRQGVTQNEHDHKLPVDEEAIRGLGTIQVGTVSTRVVLYILYST